MSLKRKKILYIHGLESGPVGAKTIALSERFDCHAEDMYMSRFNIFKKNSVIRNAVRQQTAPFLVFSAPLIVAAARGFYPRLVLPSIACYFVGMYYLRDVMLRPALRASLEQCVEIQQRAIAEYRPDVVVGSSWGGAVATELLKRGVWRGPTVLLAPAWYDVQKLLHADTASKSLDTFHKKHLWLALGAQDKKYLIVHGDDDQVISVKHSRLFHEFNRYAFDLKVIPNAEHRLRDITASGQLCDIVDAYVI